MAIVKTARTLLASQSLAPGASVNSAELNLATAAGARVFVKLTNGASAPTTSPTVTFYSGESTGTKRTIHSASGDVVNASVTHVPCSYTIRDMFANVTITNGATNSITVEVYASEASSL